NFEVEVEYFGAKRAVPLAPGGSATPVTGANVRAYVRRLVEWTLEEGVEAQFRAFAQGFHQVCGGPALSLFQHEELELLVCGLPHLDFGAMRANARYEGGYSRAHPTIVMFWQHSVQNFEVEVEYFGAKRAVPLAPGGSATPVTGANVRAYVRRLVEWTLEEGVEAQFRAFAQGFHQVCGGPALSLFQHEELELLVCGLPHLDFGAMRANARYEGGYSRAHPTIVMFWQVLSELDMDQKRRFLAFSTGCNRAPVAGLGALVLTIQRSGPDSERLPSAHTCFNTLLLPDYATRARLKAKLLLAIENAQGFGLR
ncbi:Ubiquitin-protein ligase E3A, partial [Tetrabaena socialis]